MGRATGLCTARRWVGTQAAQHRQPATQPAARKAGACLPAMCSRHACTLACCWAARDAGRRTHPPWLGRLPSCLPAGRALRPRHARAQGRQAAPAARQHAEMAAQSSVPLAHQRGLGGALRAAGTARLRSGSQGLHRAGGARTPSQQLSHAAAPAAADQCARQRSRDGWRGRVDHHLGGQGQCVEAGHEGSWEAAAGMEAAAAPSGGGWAAASLPWREQQRCACGWRVRFGNAPTISQRLADRPPLHTPPPPQPLGHGGS